MKARVLRLLVAMLCVLGMQFATVATVFTPSVAAHALSHPLQHAITPPECPQPPQNVNLTTLSDATLQLYGLPSHATMAQNPQQWADVLAHAKYRTCSPPAAAPSHSPQPLASCPYPTSLCHSDIWAGNVAIQSNKQAGVYRDATVYFHVPTIKLSDTNARVGLWAGVGGDGYANSHPVIVQAGVDISVLNGKQYNESFWEVVPGFSEQNLPLCHLYVGDYVYAYAESNLNNDGYDYFFIENESASCYNYCYLATASGKSNTCTSGGYSSAYNSDSTTGECIVERPGSGGGDLYDLAQFQESGQPNNTVELRTCEANGVAIGSQSHSYTQIYNSSGTELASVGAIVNNGDFPVTWLHSS